MLEVHDLSKEYPTSVGSLRVFSGIELSLDAGDSASIIGPSGSGKSTLLYLLGALETPTSGTVLLDGRNPFALDEKQLAAFRNEKIGFVFQDSHLLPQRTVLENVLIPTLVASWPEETTRRKALGLLYQVGLGPRVHHRPHELSGGEKQRVALARALIGDPRLVLCDEPTGNLDEESAENVTSLLLELHQKRHNILIVVTHNLGLASRLPLNFRLVDTHLHAYD